MGRAVSGADRSRGSFWGRRRARRLARRARLLRQELRPARGARRRHQPVGGAPSRWRLRRPPGRDRRDRGRVHRRPAGAVSGTAPARAARVSWPRSVRSRGPSRCGRRISPAPTFASTTPCSASIGTPAPSSSRATSRKDEAPMVFRTTIGADTPIVAHPLRHRERERALAIPLFAEGWGGFLVSRGLAGRAPCGGGPRRRTPPGRGAVIAGLHRAPARHVAAVVRDVRRADPAAHRRHRPATGAHPGESRPTGNPRCWARR